MYSLLLLGAVSFLSALLLTPLCRVLFHRLGWLDPPNHERHTHAHAVPRVGGIPIALACLTAYGALLLSGFSGGEIARARLDSVTLFLPSATLIFLTGLLDDLLTLKPWQKLAGQLVAAIFALVAGVQVTNLLGYPLPVWVAIPLTLLWLIGCSNAFNLIDGVDGLATGVGLFATATMFVAALLDNNFVLALATVPLAGALLGFLRYNFNPASIFLGDSGSLTLGFLLGCYGVLWGQKSTAAIGMTAPLMALAVPLLDTAIAIARRFLRRQPIFVGDRGHIHHRLLDRGLSPRKVVLLLYGVCGLSATFALLFSVGHAQYSGLILILFCAAAWIGVQHLGFVEFGTAGRMFVEGAFRRHLNFNLALGAFESTLTAAKTDDDRWRTICDASREFGFCRVELQFRSRLRSEILSDTNGEPTWSIRVPLAADDYVHLIRAVHSPTSPTVLGPFADALHKHLTDLPTVIPEDPPRHQALTVTAAK